MRYLLVGLIHLVLSHPSMVQGGETLNAAVDYREGRYTVHSEFLVELPAPQVRAILSRVENLPRVNDGIIKVTVLRRDPNGQLRMQVLAQVCILFICLDYSWVQEVQTLPDGDILAVMDPRESDFQEGWARWRLLPIDDRTRLVFDAQLVPDFWFPPIIGPWLMKRKLYNETLETALGVERLGLQK